MRAVLSRDAIRDFDRYWIDKCNIDGFILMENAGRGAADVIQSLVAREPNPRVLVLCGPGNNGGDGFVVARRLRIAGIPERLLLTEPRGRVRGDAQRAMSAYEATGGVVQILGEDVNSLRDALIDATHAVDAVFGTGLDRELSSRYATIVACLNDADVHRVALDLPSGLFANGVSSEHVVNAHDTVTFSFPKLGLRTPQGFRCAGHLHVVDIGVPSEPIGDVSVSAWEISEADVRRWIEPRAVDTHKYAAGHVGVIGGAPGTTGAPLLSAIGSLRAGAGVATIAARSDAYATLAGRALEVMVRTLQAESIVDDVIAFLAGKHALVVGPGLGCDSIADQILETVVSHAAVPLVLDADALTLVAKGAARFSLPRGTVLTPHPGEAARLLGTTASVVEADRYGALAALVSRTRAIVVLKGACTLIGAPSETPVVVPLAEPALATAGSGDVLAGAIGALAVHLAPFQAAAAGAVVHAIAGTHWKSDRGMLASDIASEIGQWFDGRRASV